MKILFFVLLIIFSVIGVSHIIFEILYRIFKSNNDKTIVLIIPKKNNFDTEFSVRSAVAKMKKLGNSSSCDIVLISDNLDEKQKKEISLIKRDFEYLKIFSAQDFSDNFLRDL